MIRLRYRYDFPTHCNLARFTLQLQRLSMGFSLQRHPFSGLVDSAGELLHTP